MTLKKLFAGLISLAAALLAVCAITVCAGADTSGDFEYSVLSDGTVSVNHYMGNVEELTIPSTIDGKKVTRIGDDFLLDCSKIISITIPNTVNSIGNCAFEFCSNLTTINIPNSVTRIGNLAFGGCSSLASVTIPDSLTEMRYEVFSDTPFLNNQTTTVKYAGKWVIDCDEDVTTATVKTGTVGIAADAFSHCSNLTSIYLPDSLISIEYSAFYSCSSLNSITIPNGVKSIGSNAFCDCSSLTSINIPDSITSMGGLVFLNTPFLNNQSSSVKYAGNWVIDCDQDATIANIKIGTVGIADAAFNECSSLTSITIPNSVLSIGYSAFSGCSSLNSLMIPDSVTKIEDYAFSHCTSLTSIAIPDGVTSIGVEAFMYCYSLSSIIIPDSVTIIDDYAFKGCSNLESIIIPNSVTNIGVCAFSNCSGLTSIIIPDSVTKISNYLFSDCTSLMSVTIPDGVKSIGNRAFDYCTSLTSINIPDSTESIGRYAFCSCNSLSSISVDKSNKCYSSKDGVLFNKYMTEIIAYPGGKNGEYIIPDGVESVGEGAFDHCKSLTSVTIPYGVTYIGDNAFSSCQSLASIKIPDGVKSIGECAFKLCSHLVSITIPDSVTSIGNNAFELCSTLESITMPNSLTEIGEHMFDSCSSLKSIIIPDGVKDIGSCAFLGCSNLTSIDIPYGVKSLEYNVLSDCGSLASIIIPDSVTSIEWAAFYDCESLKDIYYTGSKEQWDKITIDRYNDNLLNTTIHYDYGKVSSPSAVSGLKLKARAADAIRLAWNKNTSADGYIIEMKDGSKWVRVGKITSNSTVEFKKSGLKAGTAYTFRVKAYKMDGKTALYSGYTTISARTNPSATTGLKLKARAADALRLTWTKNASADGYIIEMKSGNSWTRVGKITNNSTVEFKKSKLKAGTAYTFRVKAYKMSGKTALYSATKTISVRTNPSAVSGLKLKASAKNAVRLSWTKNTSADGYIIEMKSGSTWTRVGKVTKNSTVEFRKDKLKAGTAYTFRVKAYKMSGSTALYSGYTTISARTNPSAVTGLKLKGRAADALRIAWTKNTSADGYIIEMKSGSTWTRVGKITSNSTIEFKKSKLKAGTAYTFRVKAYKMSGKTALYGATKSISVRTNPSAVSGLKLKASAKNAVRLSWTKNTSADGYIIEIKSGNTWTRVGKVTKNSTVEFRKGSLKSKTSYTFRIKAYKMSGKTALYGTAKTITVKTK